MIATAPAAWPVEYEPMAAPPSPEQQLRDRWLLRSLPLAYTLAVRWADDRREFDVEQLIEFALLGLVRALNICGSGTEDSFRSFAEPVINAELAGYIREHEHTLPLGLRARQRLREAQAARQEIATAVGRQDNVRELAHSLGCNVGDVVDGLLAAATQDPALLTRRADPGARAAAA